MKDTRREEGVRQTGETGRANAITEGVIWKQLLLFFFPILFGTFFQQLYNTADAVVVGRFVGKEALAAVGGSTSMLTNLLVGFFVGLSSGATVIIAQFYGAGRGQRVSSARAAGARSTPSRARSRSRPLKTPSRRRCSPARKCPKRARAFSSSSSVKWRWTTSPARARSSTRA